METLDRLILLLEYSEQAIDYWFDGWDVSDEFRSENDHYKLECRDLLALLKKARDERDEDFSKTIKKVIDLTRHLKYEDVYVDVSKIASYGPCG